MSISISSSSSNMVQEQGIHGTGAQKYTSEQYMEVVSLVKHLPANGRITVANLHAHTKISGMAIRAILSAADGVDLLLGGSGKGYQLAYTEEEAQKLDSRFLHQIESMVRRVDRRQAYADKMWKR